MVVERSPQDYEQDYERELVTSSDPLIICLKEAISLGLTPAQVIDNLRARRTARAKEIEEVEQSLRFLRVGMEVLTNTINLLVLKD
jgi:hypothetical protein